MKAIVVLGRIEGFDTVLASLLFADLVLDKAVRTCFHRRKNFLWRWRQVGAGLVQDGEHSVAAKRRIEIMPSPNG
jgi:hypothetical protein